MRKCFVIVLILSAFFLSGCVHNHYVPATEIIVESDIEEYYGTDYQQTMPINPSFYWVSPDHYAFSPLLYPGGCIHDRPRLGRQERRRFRQKKRRKKPKKNNFYLFFGW